MLFSSSFFVFSLPICHFKIMWKCLNIYKYILYLTLFCHDSIYGFVFFHFLRAQTASRVQSSPRQLAVMSTACSTCTTLWTEPPIYTSWWSRSMRWLCIRSTGPTTSCWYCPLSSMELEQVCSCYSFQDSFPFSTHTDTYSSEMSVSAISILIHHLSN